MSKPPGIDLDALLGSDEDPEVIAARAALEGKDEGVKGRCRALLCRAISTWNYRHRARGFLAWLDIVRMESKRSVPARLAHILTVEPKHRTYDEIDLIRTWMCSEYGAIFGELVPDSLSVVARALEFRRVVRKEVLFMQGQAAKYFFVVTSGQLSACAQDVRAAEKRLADYLALERDSDGNILRHPDTLDGYCGFVLRQLRAGDCVGEMALLTSDSVRSASIVGKAAVSEVLQLDKWVYRRYVAPFHRPYLLMKKKVTMLRSLPVFASMDSTKLVHVAYAFDVRFLHFPCLQLSSWQV